MAHRIIKDDGRDMCSECGEEICGCGLEHPAMHQVIELFDVTVISDLEWDMKPFYALGQRPELSAGLRGFHMTPYFNTLDELEAFCRRNLQRFKEIIDADPEAPAPDATNWEV